MTIIGCLRTVSKPNLISQFSKPKTKPQQQSCSLVMSSIAVSYDKELAAAKKAASLAACLCLVPTTNTLAHCKFVVFEQYPDSIIVICAKPML